MTDYTSRFIPLWWDNIIWWDILNHDQICKINIHWRIKGIYNRKSSITLILSWDIIWVDFKKTMIYNWIKLQNEYEYALAPQYRIANCDDYITSNLLVGIWISYLTKNKTCLMILTRLVSDKKQELPSLRDHMSSLPSFWWGLCCLSLYFSVMSFLLGFFNVCLRFVFCSQCCLQLWIVYSWFF